MELGPYKGNKPFAFISYSSNDKKRVFEIANSLRRSGYRVWWDEAINIGSEITEEITHSIEQCSLFLALLSSSYCKSDWCWKELRYAQDSGKPIYAVRIDSHLDLDEFPRFKFHLRDNHIGCFFSNNQPDNFISTISGEGNFALCYESHSSISSSVVAKCHLLKRITLFSIIGVFIFGIIFLSHRHTDGQFWNNSGGIDWLLQDDTLYIRRSGWFGGKMPEYDYHGKNHVPWAENQEDILFVCIEDGVKNIGSRAFAECENMIEIEIPESITSIGASAFEWCNFEYIEIPNGVTSIGDDAFFGCTNLMSIAIPKGVNTIGERVFGHCESLSSITLLPGINSIGEWAFEECSSLSRVNIPEGVTSIGDYAFAYCVELRNVSIPYSIDYIGNYAFTGCLNLKEVDLPVSAELGKDTFPDETDLFVYGPKSS